jgi:hypothetical protein
MKILPIVEGEGDLAAVPALLRHVLNANNRFDVELLRPHRRGEWPSVKRQFDRYFQVAALEGSPILWVMDFDCDECHSVDDERAWAMREAQRINPDVPLEVCFMVLEFESLFLADEATVRKVFSDIPAHVAFPTDPERVRDAKGWLSTARPTGAAYKPTIHQARLAAQVDIQALRQKSPSFCRFEESVLRLVPQGDFQ